MYSLNGLHYTLFLWPESLFSRRLAYYLLLKGLVASPKDLVVGKTTVPNLTLNIIHLDVEKMVFESITNPLDPKPDGRSLPCLRVTDPYRPTTAARPLFINESTSILNYLEYVYGDAVAYPQHFPSLRGNGLLDRAVVDDLEALANEVWKDASYYLRHASRRGAAFWSGVPDHHRSRPAGENARAFQDKDLHKLLRLAKEGGGLKKSQELGHGGWLTPGGHGPGIADVALAGFVQYARVAYSWDVLEGDGLEELRDWWARFSAQDWFVELDRLTEHPVALTFGREDLDF